MFCSRNPKVQLNETFQRFEKKSYSNVSNKFFFLAYYGSYQKCILKFGMVFDETTAEGETKKCSLKDVKVTC